MCLLKKTYILFLLFTLSILVGCVGGSNQGSKGSGSAATSSTSSASTDQLSSSNNTLTPTQKRVFGNGNGNTGTNINSACVSNPALCASMQVVAQRCLFAGTVNGTNCCTILGQNSVENIQKCNQQFTAKVVGILNAQ
ncbi:MAG: hypothetical protein HQK49_18190 [Oligoflexia bacterium]|nr:hypothetical protein [Oligoflexia bacterium]